MQNHDNLIRQLTEQITQHIEENRWLKDRLDIALNTFALQQEEIQRLKEKLNFVRELFYSFFLLRYTTLFVSYLVYRK